MNNIVRFFDISPTQLKTIKATCDPTYVIGKALSKQGMHSTMKEACNGSDCKYVAKMIMPMNTVFDAETYCFNEAEAIENEFALSQMMSDMQIGPKVFDYCITPEYAMIIMEKYDGTLTDLLMAMQESSVDFIPIDEIRNLTAIMNNAGIIHNDLQSNNILYKVGKDGKYKFAITDFGLGFITNSDELKNVGDLDYVNGIQYVYDQIREGKKYDEEEIVLEIVDQGVSNTVFRKLRRTGKTSECTLLA